MSIDLTKTKAYHYQLDESSSYANIFVSVNLKGREANGIVEPGKEYAEVKTSLITALSNLKIVETGEKLFEEVTETNLSQRDIKVSIKHDINLLGQQVRINDDIYALRDFYIFLDKSGDHSDPGVFIIYGKNIQKAKIIKDAYILDITPTILYLLGLPVARDMEGKVLVEAIDANFLTKNPIRYIDTYETMQKSIHQELKPHLIDVQELEKLRSLGYVH